MRGDSIDRSLHSSSDVNRLGVMSSEGPRGKPREFNPWAHDDDAVVVVDDAVDDAVVDDAVVDDVDDTPDNVTNDRPFRYGECNTSLITGFLLGGLSIAHPTSFKSHGANDDKLSKESS